MQAAPLIAIAVLAAAGTSVLAVKVLREDTALASSNADTTALEGEIASLRKEVQALQSKLTAVQTPKLGGGGETRTALSQVSAQQIDAAVARWMAANAERVGVANATGKAKVKPFSEGQMKQQFMQLLDLDKNWNARAKIWDRLVKSGQIKDMIAKFKENADKSPGNADAQCAYGHALVQKIMMPGISMLEQQVTGMAIDKAYQKALKVDPGHWDARFSRALGMTHWPPFMDGKSKAIKEFQTLIEQQKKRQPKPQYANTYVFLGNMYSQQGKNEKAKEIWKQGANLYPDSKDLKAKLKD